MASEETTQTATENQDGAAENTAHLEQTSAQTDADDASTTTSDAENSAELNSESVSGEGFETEATAPEIAAYEEVQDGSTIDSQTAETVTEPNADSDGTVSSAMSSAENSDAAAPDSDLDQETVAADTNTALETAGVETAEITEAEVAAPSASAIGEAAEVAQTATAETVIPDKAIPAIEENPADSAIVTDAESPAKKENVVVKKLKLNPKAAAEAAELRKQQQEEQQKAEAVKAAEPPKTAQPVQAPRPKTIPVPAIAEFVEPAEDSQSDSMDFGDILKQFESEQARFREGDMVEGKVVGIQDRGVLIDFGYKSEGLAPTAEFLEDGELKIQQGDTVEVVVKRMGSPEGLPELSRFEAIVNRTWDELEKASEEGTIVKGRVIDKIKGGLTVDIKGVEAFLPGSQIDSRPPRNLDGFKGQEIEARVIKFNRKRGNVVLSRKVILDEVYGAQKAETMAQIAEGYIVEGKIKSMTEYGAFVDIGGIDGLLHVTDMSWGKLDRPSDLFKPNDDLQVKVLKIDRDKERISLGYKQLIPNPWQSVAERYEISSKHIGKVSSMTDYGAFVELEPGIEGLVHVSEMTWSKRAKHPNKIVNIGQEIEVQVLRIDQRERRVSLGMRQVMTNPWETIYERYPIGTKVHGRVRNMTDFGAFVEIEEGVDGLVHLSDITHSKKIKHASEILKKNQEVDAVVTGINVEGRRMSLSMKELQPSSWDAFVATHKPGDVVTGKISRFANFGVFVELGDELEGLCHISELSDERIEKPEKVFEIGQELEFKILRIEPDVQKIGLSHRSVGREDDPVIDTKTYSTEAKSGMASLGELSNLRSMFGGESETQEPAPEEQDSQPAAE